MLEDLKIFIEEHPEHKAIIVATVLKYQDIQSEWHRHRCNICDKLLSVTEKESIEPMHFLITCFDHRKWAEVYQSSIIRERLGIPQRNYINEQTLKTL
jgi:hypothetical protein